MLLDHRGIFDLHRGPPSWPKFCSTYDGLQSDSTGEHRTSSLVQIRRTHTSLGALELLQLTLAQRQDLEQRQRLLSSA